MKNNLLLVIVTITTMGWSARNTNSGAMQYIGLQPYYLTKADAEKILGQTAALTDSMATNKNNVAAYRCTYTADDKDPETGKSGAVYFMIEHFNNLTSAKEVYQSFKTSNQNSSGFKTLSDIGDEGWFHTDGENFCLIIVRKNDKMLRLKVNKLTSKTSMEAFREVAGKIAGDL